MGVHEYQTKVYQAYHRFVKKLCISAGVLCSSYVVVSSNLSGMASTITRFKFNRKYLALQEEELQKSVVDIATKNDLREIQTVWRNIKLDYIRNCYQSTPDA